MAIDRRFDEVHEQMWPKAFCGCGHHFVKHDPMQVGDDVDLPCMACACENYDGPNLPEVDNL